MKDSLTKDSDNSTKVSVVKVCVINSFTYQGTGGNPAGVVMDLENHLSDAEMQAIAKEVGYSETAFISKGDAIADFNVRFFTPAAEVDLCGHATLASFWYLAKTGHISDGFYTQRTKAGLLNVKVAAQPAAPLKLVESDSDYKITMAQTSPRRTQTEDLNDAQFSLSFPTVALHPTLPLEVWSTGLEDLILPLESLDALNALEVNFQALSTYSSEHHLVGAHAFCIEDHQVHARNFAPLYDIDEESATGTSNGALAAYLHQHVYTQETRLELDVLQGEAMNATSLIQVLSEIEDGNHHIWVGGFCKYVKDFQVSIQL